MLKTSPSLIYNYESSDIFEGVGERRKYKKETYNYFCNSQHCISAGNAKYDLHNASRILKIKSVKSLHNSDCPNCGSAMFCKKSNEINKLDVPEWKPKYKDSDKAKMNEYETDLDFELKGYREVVNQLYNGVRTTIGREHLLKSLNKRKKVIDNIKQNIQQLRKVMDDYVAATKLLEMSVTNL